MKGGKLLPFARGLSAGNPIMHPMQLADFVQKQCGAEGYRIEGDMLVALRWDLDGNELIVDRYLLSAVSA